ncbi:pyridine nucleotide-disulfide oxidoreductase-like protein [Hyaloraphidium curvatum]|nr:pyridine nucleotide-disulfide oxidoreductase-like protein [Hyaloraphidium curvatum]
MAAPRPLLRVLFVSLRAAPGPARPATPLFARGAPRHARRGLATAVPPPAPEKSYDLVVVGAGPSGFAAAMRAADFGKKVLLIERDKVGGAGIHSGALSSKTLWSIATDAARLRSLTQSNKVAIEMNTAIGMTELVVEARQEQMMRQILAMRDRGVDFAQADAKLLSNTEVLLIPPTPTSHSDPDYKTRSYKPYSVRTKYIILATGSRPRVPKDIPVDENLIATSDGIHTNWTRWPQSAVIVGAGVIGCEFATVLALTGVTKVNLIANRERILPFEDEDVARVIENNLIAKGVTIHRNAKLENMCIEAGQRVKYTLSFPDGHTEVHRVARALVSIGREPNIKSLNLAAAGIELNKRGHIRCDRNTQTTAPNVFAVGDLTADICLVNVGEVEGRHAVESIWGKDGKGGVDAGEEIAEDVCYDNISTIMFLQPEVAGVGLNEQECRRLHIPYRASVYSYELIGRALAMRGESRQGFFKLIVTPDDEMRVLGMRAIGEHSSSAIQAVSLMIKEGISARKLADLVHPHPSIVEGIQECVRMLIGNSIMKPACHPGLLSLREWHPTPQQAKEEVAPKEPKIRVEAIDSTVGQPDKAAAAA